MIDTLLNGLLYGGMFFATLAFLGPLAGLRRRTCLRLWVAADLLFIAGTLPGLPDPGWVVIAGFWVYELIRDVQRLRRNDDDDDDDKPRRRRRLRLRRPSWSRLVLPGMLQPAGGAA